MYRALQANFRAIKWLKQKADQIEIPKSAPAEKRRKEEEEIHLEKKNLNPQTPNLHQLNLSPEKINGEVKTELPKAEEKITENIEENERRSY